MQLDVYVTPADELRKWSTKFDTNLRKTHMADH